jgi:hypothetical protein
VLNGAHSSVSVDFRATLLNYVLFALHENFAPALVRLRNRQVNFR